MMLHMHDTQRDSGGVRLAIWLLSAVALLVATDLVMDDQAGADPTHLLMEGLLMAVSVGGALWLWLTLRRARIEVVTLERDVASAREEALRWRDEARDALRGLGVSIGKQFERWDLTPAEREVALLLLKGLSHKEAARVRKVSERTVRQQAREVYRKAGLAGRSELSAFFLEDLLVPSAGEAAGDRGGGPS
jgi:DNA-binding CsgD family transcriptional regulator